MRATAWPRAAVGFMRTFGMDEPMGCYDDIEARRRVRAVGLEHGGDAPDPVDAGHRPAAVARRNVKVAVLSTFEHRSFELADIPIVFTPQTDLAILNYIAQPHHQDRTASTSDFVDKHTTFRLGNDRHRLRAAAGAPAAEGGEERRRRRAARQPIDFDEYAKFVSTLRRSTTRPKLSRRAEEPARGAGRALRRPEGQGDVVLDHGLQPAHARRVGNNLVYNLHLLTGKIATPGNSPFSLTGQPSACGTAREVGTFSHRLPADMVVTNPEHRADGRGDLEAAAGHDPRQARLSRRAAEPHAQGRQAQRLLGAGQQQHAGRRRT